MQSLRQFQVEEWISSEGLFEVSAPELEAPFRRAWESVPSSQWQSCAVEAWVGFLRRRGFLTEAFEFMSLCLSSGSAFPWLGFVDCLYDLQFEISPDLQKSIIEGAESQGQLRALLKSRLFSLVIPNRHEAITGQDNQLRWEWNQKIHQDLDEVLLLESQGRTDEAMEKLEPIKKRAPQNDQVIFLHRQLHKKQVLETLQKKTPNRVLLEALHRRSRPSATDEELGLLKQWHQDLQSLIKAYPEMGGDFSLLSLFMENYDSAAELSRKQGSDSIWLTAEILMRAEKGAELLGHLGKVEETLPQDDLDGRKALHYYSAWAQRLMGNLNQAVQLLIELETIDPEYREILSLKKQWLEEMD